MTYLGWMLDGPFAGGTCWSSDPVVHYSTCDTGLCDPPDIKEHCLVHREMPGSRFGVWVPAEWPYLEWAERAHTRMLELGCLLPVKR